MVSASCQGRVLGSLPRLALLLLAFDPAFALAALASDPEAWACDLGAHQPGMEHLVRSLVDLPWELGELLAECCHHMWMSISFSKPALPPSHQTWDAQK